MYIIVTTKTNYIQTKLFGLQWQGAPSKNVPGNTSSILVGNNVWSVRMLLRTSWISRPLLESQKPVQKPKKKKKKSKLYTSLSSLKKTIYIIV